MQNEFFLYIIRKELVFIYAKNHKKAGISCVKTAILLQKTLHFVFYQKHAKKFKKTLALIRNIIYNSKCCDLSPVLTTVKVDVLTFRNTVPALDVVDHRRFQGRDLGVHFGEERQIRRHLGIHMLGGLRHKEVGRRIVGEIGRASCRERV